MTWSGIYRILLIFAVTLGHLSAYGDSPGDGPDAGDASGADEVFLAFRYRGVDNTIVSAYHLNGEIYLPVIDLFSLLKISYTFDYDTRAIHGQYISANRTFELNLHDGHITIGETIYPLEDGDFLRQELEYYIRAGIFEAVFGLNFLIDTSQLTLSLTTDDTLPVVEQLERRRRYRDIPVHPWMRESYPLAYGRNRSVLNGSFLDYTVTSSVTDRGNALLYSTGIGAEVLGGDIQGFLIGAHTTYGSYLYTRDLRWRYVLGDDPLLRSVSLGNVYSTGLMNRPFTGIQLSNEPIEPRVIYDDYVVEGIVEPDAEVELYFNNQLVEVQSADALGNYRFMMPLAYGTSQLRLMVYAPSGEVSEIGRRIQIPYTFLPRGEVSYNVSAGSLDGYTNMLDDDPMTVQSNVAVGLTSWLTAKTGVDYFNQFYEGRPIYYSSIAGRIARQYLVGIDVAPGALYRISSNVTYSSAASWGVSYTYFDGDGIYNPSARRRELHGSVFMPFRMLAIPMSLRIAANRYEYNAASITGLRADLHVRHQRANFRLGYHDRFATMDGLPSRSDGRISAVINYTFPRRRTTPLMLRGLLLRSQAEYGVHNTGLERIDLQISRSMSRKGRFYLRYENRPRRGQRFFEGGLTIDFNRVRATTTARTNNGDYAATQTLRGSIGFDATNRLFILDNRSQVGRSGASVRLFMDRNGSGSYDDGDVLLPYDAVRVPSARKISAVREGVLHISQLQPYRRYNLEILESGIKNPLLVPSMQRISFIADPNTYKTIDIPFYMTGVIEGTVHRDRAGRVSPVSGLRVYVREENTGSTLTLRTYGDGTFYAMGVPPGRYSVYLDSLQLGLIGASFENTGYPIEILSLPDGDFVDNLAFLLREGVDPLADGGTDVRKVAPIIPYDDSFIADPTALLAERDAGLDVRAMRPYFETAGEMLVMVEGGKGGLSVAARVRLSEDRESAHAGRAYPVIDGREYPAGSLHPAPGSKCMCPAINGSNLSDLGYVVVLGPFDSAGAASDAARALEHRLRTRAPIHYDAASEDYFLHLEPIVSIEEARLIVKSLNDQPDFETARVVSTYRLAIDDEESQEADGDYVGLR